MEREDLVSICTVDNPVEAEIIRGALESAGIACKINGETQAGLVGISAFQIDIMTTLADADRARKHLRELRPHKKMTHEHAIEEHEPGDE